MSVNVENKNQDFLLPCRNTVENLKGGKSVTKGKTVSKIFHAGRTYKITMRDESGGIMTIYNCLVHQYDEENGLLKIIHNSTEKVLNVRCPEFIMAELVDK